MTMPNPPANEARPTLLSAASLLPLLCLMARASSAFSPIAPSTFVGGVRVSAGKPRTTNGASAGGRTSPSAFVDRSRSGRWGVAETVVLSTTSRLRNALSRSEAVPISLGMTDDDGDSGEGREGGEEEIDFDDLVDMDIVLFRHRGGSALFEDKNEEPSLSPTSSPLEIGALQEDGTLAPLSAWTIESAFGDGSSDSIEFLVDEEDRFPGLTKEDVSIRSVLDGAVIGYGSRQVGGGKGPGNPHGEESELLYYVDRKVLVSEDGEEIVSIVIKPELEILW